MAYVIRCFTFSAHFLTVWDPMTFLFWTDSLPFNMICQCLHQYNYPETLWFSQGTLNSVVYSITPKHSHKCLWNRSFSILGWESGCCGTTRLKIHKNSLVGGGECQRQVHKLCVAVVTVWWWASVRNAIKSICSLKKGVKLHSWLHI